MITTKQVNVNLTRGKLKLRHVTTKNIDASIRVEPPKAPIKTKSITTTTQQDVADIAEKKRRDDIMAERKLTMKDAKKIVISQAIPKKVTVRNEKKIVVIEKKKPWNKMNAKERKEYQAEKAKKEK